jgi:hypothetical protein
VFGSRGFRYPLPYARPIVLCLPSRTFTCNCGASVTTTAKNKYQCDKCQAEHNRECSRRASRRQDERNRAKGTGQSR